MIRDDFGRHLNDIRVSHIHKNQTMPTILLIRSTIHRAMSHLIFVSEAANEEATHGCEVPTNLYCRYSIMKS